MRREAGRVAGGGDAKKGEEEAGVGALSRMGRIQPRAVSVRNGSKPMAPIGLPPVSDASRPVLRDLARRFDSGKRKSGHVRASLPTSASVDGDSTAWIILIASQLLVSTSSLDNHPG